MVILTAGRDDEHVVLRNRTIPATKKINKHVRVVDGRRSACRDGEQLAQHGNLASKGGGDVHGALPAGRPATQSLDADGRHRHIWTGRIVSSHSGDEACCASCQRSRYRSAYTTIRATSFVLCTIYACVQAADQRRRRPPYVCITRTNTN
ncbi:hypothetical protein BS78_03G030300 [Paspalum vaginatum]|nr:hypothetical protein BS78_03G030300 [Paspalum vaginatum]